MKNVAKQVKKTLNEGNLYPGELEYIGEWLKYPIRAAMAEKNGKEFTNSKEQQNINYSGYNIDVDIKFGGDNLYSHMPNSIKEQMISNCAGFIVEGYIAKIFNSIFKKGDYILDTDDRSHYDVLSYKYNSNKSLYDFDVSLYTEGEKRDVSFEVKAFKDGNTNNITLTKNQSIKLHSSCNNVYYILVDYSLGSNAIIFNHMYIFDGDDATKLLDPNKASRHITKDEFKNAYTLF